MTSSSPEQLRMAGLGKWLAGGIGVVTAATTAVGIGSGDLGRVLRNEAPRATLYLLLLGLGIGAGVVVWHTAGSSGEPGDKHSRVGGLALAVFGIAALVVALGLFWPDAVELTATRWGAIIVLVLFALAAFVVLWRQSRREPSNRNDVATYVATAAIILSLAGVLLAFLATTARAGVILLGLVMAVLALTWVNWPISFSIDAILIVVGFIAFAVGLSGFFSLAVANSSAKDRPTIDASLSVDEGGSLALTAGVVASGLRTDEHVLVTVEGLSREVLLSDIRAGRGGALFRLTNFGDNTQPLHLSRTGPDLEGNVDLELVVPISPGLYERLRINAFLVSAESEDLLGQLEQLDRRVAEDAADRAAYDERIGANELTAEIEEQRAQEDAAYQDGDIDDTEYDVILKQRQADDEDRYREAVGGEVLDQRDAFDQDVMIERNRLLELLETEIVQDVRCSVRAQARGCVIILVPEIPERPLITAAPATANAGREAQITVDMASMSAEDYVLVTVAARANSGQEYEPIYKSQLPPDGSGNVTTSLTLPLESDVIDVCVTGQLMRMTRDQPSPVVFAPASRCEATQSDVTVVSFVVPDAESG
jgi:hypothetical protein